MTRMATDLSNTETMVFDSIPEAVRAAREGHYRRPDDSCVNRASFIGRHFSDWSEVESACRKVWNVGSRIVDDMIHRLSDIEIPQLKSRRRRVRWSDSGGDDFCFDRLRNGQDFWRSTPRQAVAGSNSVTIVADVGANCNVNAEDILWRGAAAVALTDILEKAGYSVDLWAFAGSRDAYTNSRDFVSLIQVKASSEPLDVDGVVIGMSGWFFRTVIFALLVSPDSNPRPGKGGRLDPTVDGIRALLRADASNILNVSNAWSFDSALTVIRSQIESLAGDPVKAV